MRFANEFGYCELNPFPGCSQIVVSNHAFIYPEKRGKGNGSVNHKLRVESWLLWCNSINLRNKYLNNEIRS